MIIERTRDSHKFGKWILMLDDRDYSLAIEKLGELFECLQKKKHLPTMKVSLTAYNVYPEINGGIPVSNELRAKVAMINSKLAVQPTTVPTLSSTPKQVYFIWGNISGSKTTITTPTPTTTASVDEA